MASQDATSAPGLPGDRPGDWDRPRGRRRQPDGGCRARRASAVAADRRRGAPRPAGRPGRSLDPVGQLPDGTLGGSAARRDPGLGGRAPSAPTDPRTPRDPRRRLRPAMGRRAGDRDRCRAQLRVGPGRLAAGWHRPAADPAATRWRPARGGDRGRAVDARRLRLAPVVPSAARSTPGCASTPPRSWSPAT